MYQDDRRSYSSRDARRRRRRRKKMLQALIPVAFAIVMIVIIAIIALRTGLFESFTYSAKKADLNSYYQCMGDNSATVIVNGEMTPERITVKNGTCYLDLDTVRNSYTDRFFYDVNDSALLYTVAEGVISTMPDSTMYTLNGTGTQTGYTTCCFEGDQLFVALDYVRQFVNFEFKLCGGNGEPYRAEIKREWGTKVLVDVTKDTDIRIEPNKKADIVREVREGAALTVYSSEGEDWLKVGTDDLAIGFVEKKYLGEKYEQQETPVTDVADVVIPTVADGSKVVLAWHNVVNESAASYLKDYSSYFQYFNTVSPTCFYICDNDGNIDSILTHDYVEAAHNAGLKVWGLVENMTHSEVSIAEILAYSSKRAHLIEQLVSYAKEYQLDGINVDIEQLPSEAGEAFVQFIRELVLEAHKYNIVISVDNYVPQGYTSHYGRKEQGVFADYVIIMGYDEHYSGSETSGSVASLPFVLDGIEQTIADVPAEKVINALPFYTRLWIETSGIISEVQTLDMTKAAETVASAGATPKWDEETGQNYAEWGGDTNRHKIWLEDADSLAAKLGVMQAHNVAGVAVWQLAYSTQPAWETISSYYPIAGGSQ